MTRAVISIALAGLFVMLAVWFVLLNKFLWTLKKIMAPYACRPGNIRRRDPYPPNSGRIDRGCVG